VAANRIFRNATGSRGRSERFDGEAKAKAAVSGDSNVDGDGRRERPRRSRRKAQRSRRCAGKTNDPLRQSDARITVSFFQNDTACGREGPANPTEAARRIFGFAGIGSTCTL
jgi:hypothetical protein